MRRRSGTRGFVASAVVAAFCGWFFVGQAQAAEPDAGLSQGPFSWTGWYFGAHAAGFSGDGDLYTPFTGISPPNATADLSGAGWGLHGGARYQHSSNLVSGIEVALTDGVSAAVPCTLRLATGQCDVEFDWQQSVTASLGYAINRFLLSGHLGYSIAQTNVRLTNSQTAGIASATGSSMTFGETYGAGLEYALRPWLILGLEWERSDYDVKLHHLTDPNGTHVGTADLKVTTDVAKVKASIKCCDGSESRPAAKTKFGAPYPWSGSYFGSDFAYIAGDGDLSIAGSSSVTADVTSYSRGMHAGVRRRVGDKVVAGAEYSLTRGASGRVPCVLALATGKCEVDFDWEQSITGRLGYARGPVLASVLVGASVSEMIVRLKESQTPGITFANSRATTVGLTYGAALEYALRSWLSLGLEWDHSAYDTQSHTLLDPTGAVVGQTELDASNDVFKVKSSILF